jgi:hypothetical protein
VPPTPSALAALVKEIQSTEVLDSDSQFAKELIEPQGDEPGQVLDDALMATINNTFEHECLEEAVALLGAVPRGDSHADAIRGPKYTLKQFPEVRFLAHQIWAIWFIVRRWIFDVDLPGALLADEMGLGKTFTILAAALYAKSIAEDVTNHHETQLPVLFNLSLGGWCQAVETGFSTLSAVQKQWYPCTHPNPVPRRLLQLLDDKPTTDLPPWNPVLCVVLPSVRATFIGAINTITKGTPFSVRDLCAEDAGDLTHAHLNFCVEHPERRWDIHVITYDTFTSRAQRNENDTVRQLTNCQWSWGIFDEAHRFKGPKSKGWSVASEAQIGFKVQVTATPAYHSLKDWGNTTRWLFTIPDAPENERAVEEHGPEALMSAITALQTAVTKGGSSEAQQEAASVMTEVAHPWTIRRWTESRLASGAPLVYIPSEDFHPVALEWSQEEQKQLNDVATRLKRQKHEGEHGIAWRIHRWQLACFSLPLEQEGDRFADGSWKEEWDASSFVEGPIFRWLRESFLPELISGSATVPEMDDQPSTGSPVLSPLPQKAVLFCPLPGQVRHLAWWIHRHFNHDIQVIRMVSEDSADRRSEVMSDFQNSPWCSVFITTTKIGGTGLNLVAANHAVILQKPWVLNEQRQAFGRIVRLGQMRKPHTWLVNTGPNGFDDRVTALHMVNGTTQLRVLHGLMNRPMISKEDVYNVLKTRIEETAIQAGMLSQSE